MILIAIKITKKLLSNYLKYKREIPFLQSELDEMLVSDSGICSSVVMDYREGYPKPQSVVGFDWERYEGRKRILESRKAQMKAVEQWIDRIEDGQTRCVFRMRYITGMSWVKIAENTGYGGKEDYVRVVIRDQYLKKCGIK